MLRRWGVHITLLIDIVPLLLSVVTHFRSFLVPFVSSLYSGCLRPTLHADNGSWNRSETS